jgi:hypothetical protein
MLRLWNGRARTHAPAGAMARVRPHRDVLSTEHEGAMVLLDLRRQVFLGLDDIGTSIWKGIEAGDDSVAIERNLAEDYDAPPELLCADVRQFVAELARRGLVVRA